MTSPRIADAVRIYQELRAALTALDPELDDETIQDTLQGETDLQESIVRLAELAIEAEHKGEAVHARMQDMMARKKRFDAQAQRLRSVILWALQEAGLQKIVAPTLTMSIGDGRDRVTITDIDELPMNLIEYTPKPLIGEIRAKLESGEAVPGATLTNSPPILTIRTK